ncbi:MAG: hypothetical protein H0W76_07605 [Pyrinomonadaceae bacterium]|nr:hypothetical protein [Pyrinomonadaceae bacterium]
MTDSILFWNAVALEANRVSHSDPDKREQNGPTISSRALAIVHLAMYDAYAGVEGNAATFPPYLNVPFTQTPGTSHADAVAGAAFTTLSALFKTQIDFFEAQQSAFDTGNQSYLFGVEVGNAMLADRAGDPGAGDNGYQISLGHGRHRVDPDNPGQGFHAPYYGMQCKGFAISERHTLDKPPFDDSEYLKSLQQVRAKGIKPELMGTLPNDLFDDKRTPLESVIGVYWAYDGANRLGTPPRLYNQIIRLVAVKQGNSEGDNARLFAFVNAAMADAGILAWEQKYCHDFWRPVVGIREHDASCGPGARNPEDAGSEISEDADPSWLPLGAPNTNTLLKNLTPPFPAYPSGHATFGAAAFHVTRLFYGKGLGNNGKPYDSNGNIIADDLFDDLSFVSEELNGGNRDNNGTVRPRHVRNFPGGLGEMIIENGISRIFLGVHWSFDAFALKGKKPNLKKDRIGGVPLGLKIATDIFDFGGGIAPKLSTVEPTEAIPTKPTPPATLGGCADEQEETETRMVQTPFPSGISPR